MTKTVISYLIKKGYTSQKSAERLGVSKKTVLRVAKKFGLQYNNIPKRFDTVEKPVIKKLLKRGYTDLEIAHYLKINRSSVNRLINKYNLKREYKVKLSKKEKSILIGTLLGDATLSKNIKTRLSFCHSQEQVSYLLWKVNQLKSLKMNTSLSTRYDKRTDKYYKVVQAWSRSSNTLNEWYNLLYQDKKIIPAKLLNHYNALSLAVHFMDDGTKTKHSYRLCTDSFDKESLEVFNLMCKVKFGISWTAGKNNRLYLPSKFKDRFTKIIKPYTHSTMTYKLHEVSDCAL